LLLLSLLLLLLRRALRFGRRLLLLLLGVEALDDGALALGVGRALELVVEAREQDAAGSAAELEALRARLRSREHLLEKAGGGGGKRAAPTAGDGGFLGLMQVIARWARETQAPEQHVEQYRYPARGFRELHGDLPLKSITKNHLRGFADAVAKLPRSTPKEVRDAPMGDAIRFGEEKGLPRISARTAKTHLAALRTILGYAENRGLVEHNPASRLHLAVPKGKAVDRERRRPFSRRQVKEVIAALDAAFPMRSDDFWIPLGAAFQGMRIEEVCQLHTADLRQIGSTWTIHVNDAGDKKLKNTASHRTIPVHPRLVTAGFIAHFQASPGPRVFASLTPDRRGRYAGPYGKRFSRFLRVRVGLKGAGLSFHSFRHTWKDAARDAGLPEDVQNRILGHR